MMITYTEKFSVRACMRRIDASLFNAEITETKKKGIEDYINAFFFFKKNGYVIPVAYLAYILATVYHETDKKMQPLEEYGKGKGKKYGKPDPITGKIYYGRGDVQVTWKDNYEKLSKMLFDKNGKKGVDLVNHPELMLDHYYSAQATIFGMATGLYTGKRLSSYLWGADPDYINARRIINGTDRAFDIAEYAIAFESAIRVGMHRSIERPAIKRGSHNSDVRELQLMLKVEPDGKYGPATETAVIEFQRYACIKDDGVVGFNTWSMLEQLSYWGCDEKVIGDFDNG